MPAQVALHASPLPATDVDPAFVGATGTGPDFAGPTPRRG